MKQPKYPDIEQVVIPVITIIIGYKMNDRTSDLFI